MRFILLCLLLLPVSSIAAESRCIPCHTQITPQIVNDFRAGKMGKVGLDCSTCHGSAHLSADDVDKVNIPTEKTCQPCHQKQYDQYMNGKHSLAWVAMDAMPKTGLQPHAYIQGLKGCGGCHKIGVRTAEQRKSSPYGNPCDSCHTRHSFSVAEARQPQTCRTCHMGFDHPQWEMWSGSKHGAIFQGDGTDNRAPSCQTCHMPEGDHGVMTAWGFLGLRLPEDDQEWLGYRTTILKGLHVLDPEGNPTSRLDVIKEGKVARLNQKDWKEERDKMLEICSKCHSSRYASVQLQNADQMLKEADKLMATGIQIVADLYSEGVIKPESGKPAYPDILAFYNANTPIEQTLYVMFMEHRMRSFQGAFHMNPDYVTWYGLAQMNRDLVDIRAESTRMRRETQREKSYP